LLPIVTEIYLCDACSCHEILRMETLWQLLPPAQVQAVKKGAVWRGVAQMDVDYWLVRGP
jgi:hypothetical protein